jgi:hypothetical protein
MIATAALPVEGLWRVARGGPEGIRFQAADRVDDDNPRGGNRFDSFTGSYGTLYFGASLEVCYAETLGRLRPKQSLALLAAGDWDEMHVMLPGNIAADWRLRRTAVRARPTSHPFVNITHPDTLAELNQHPTLMAGLAHYGIDDLDLSDVTGKDRRVTRFIAKYIHDLQDNDGEPAWGGVRYLSRLGEGWACWAISDHCTFEVLERKSIAENDPDLLTVTDRFGITVH